MPQIVRCEEKACCHNRGSLCRAGAIVIGARRRPVCHRRSLAKARIAPREIIGTVEICHMLRCIHNEESLCTAFSGVLLRSRGGDACCSVFKAAEVPLVASGKTTVPAEPEEQRRPSRVVKAPRAS
jgi:hypothetical protein